MHDNHDRRIAQNPGYAVQAVLNAHDVPDRHLQVDPDQPIAVRARIVWAEDGAQTIDTVARSWSGNLVLVDVIDARSLLRGLWLDAGDVTRRER